MSCCTHCCGGEKQFDANRAESDRREYRHNGPDAITELLLEELRPMKGNDLLDIGGGIGVIGTELAKRGIIKVTVVEASPAYLEVARQVLADSYAEGLAQLVLGDFALIAETLPDADVVTMGRVVCCYPDAEGLLRGAATRTRRVLAFTYPRDTWYVRTGNVIENLIRRLRKNPFRTYVHSPREMERTLERAGLVRSVRRKTFTWMLDVYERR